MSNYAAIQISSDQALQLAKDHFGLNGTAKKLPGESDFNFRIATTEGNFLLKISRPNSDQDFVAFQKELLDHMAMEQQITSPEVVPTLSDKSFAVFTDDNGEERIVRLLTWIDGRLWSEVNPISNALLYSLGTEIGKMTTHLTSFDHSAAHRHLEWDVAQSLWTTETLNLFKEEERTLICYFQERFQDGHEAYQSLRKSIIHGDVNDNNIVVSSALINPVVTAVIDYGDAVFTQTVNELAVALAYAIMDKADPLSAAMEVMRGSHSEFPLQEEELAQLYDLVAMRLIISISKGAMNMRNEPDNKYHQISVQPAWDALRAWKSIHPNFAHYAFRTACGFSAHPNARAFEDWCTQHPASLNTLFQSLTFSDPHIVDMSVSSTWLGPAHEYDDLQLGAYKMERMQKAHPASIMTGGYLEVRPFYSTDAYKVEGNNGPEYRTVHLGIDCWVDAETPIYAPYDGTVISVHDNAGHKDYGPTIIVRHTASESLHFYTLYGHLTLSSLTVVQEGQEVKQGELIGYVGAPGENGHWVPHLHFQVMLDMLGNTIDFPGVARPKHRAIWSGICPDPNALFQDQLLKTKEPRRSTEITKSRQQHLGSSLSLSYQEPLTIVRGQGTFLIDQSGRKYLDTVNNVAHVGHEHPRVARAGQQQMGLLNTNTRYLHPNITDFAEELLETFPAELNVVHFVNSGSEANELALRMAKAATQQRAIIALEIGYHGNTNACIDISSYKFDGKGGSGAPENTYILPLPDTYRGLYTDDKAAAQYASHIDVHLETLAQKGQSPAAFIGESIVSCGGQIELPKNYLQQVYKKVRAAGGICIADEVQVGCGRVGSHWWGFELHDVIPDIVTIGKPLGNGHPVAAVVCTSSIAQKFANGMEYFNTFGGNPVSSAIGQTVLKVVKEEQLRANAQRVGQYLKKGLQALQKRFPIIGEVRGQGLFLGFELVDSDKQPLAPQTNYLANRMVELGVLMSTDGKDNNVIKIKPPMVFSQENADELLGRLAVVLDEDFMLNY